MTNENRLADLIDRLDSILVEESPMHPFGCATWEESSRIAIDMAKDALTEALSPSEQPEPVAWPAMKSGHDPVVTLSSRIAESSASGVRVDEDPQTWPQLEARLRECGPGDTITLDGWAAHLVLSTLYAQPSEQTGARDAIKAARKYLLQIQEGREVRQEDGSTRMEDWDASKVSTLAGIALAALGGSR